MKGYYINLDSRKDRKEHFEKNIKKYPFFSNIKRFNAVYHKAYGVGCILSHIGCIKELLNGACHFAASFEPTMSFFKSHSPHWSARRCACNVNFAISSALSASSSAAVLLIS